MSTFDVGEVHANATQARESEVARLYYNLVHWGSYGVTTVEIFDSYFGGGGYLKYHVRAGNSNSYEIQLMEAHGHTSQMQLVFGTPVDTGGDFSGYDNYYIPVKVQARHYRQVKVRVSTTLNVVDAGYTGYGAISISPISHNNISDFGDVIHTVYEPNNLNVGGTLNVGSNATANNFFYSSDKQLKKDIRKINNPLDKIMQLEGVSFKWQEDNEESLGLIAQDVEKVFPELVSTNNEGLKTVAYGNLIAPLIEALKVQENEIKQLSAQIKELRNNYFSVFSF